MNARDTLDAAIASAQVSLDAKRVQAADLAAAIEKEQANLDDLISARDALPRPSEAETDEPD